LGVDATVMRKRAPILVLLAAIILGSAIVVAVNLPATCPDGYHPYSSIACESDATHIAPSSGVRIPVAMTPPDQRRTLRGEIGMVGFVLASGLLLAAWGERERRATPA
jgi:hypothetical protein